MFMLENSDFFFDQDDVPEELIAKYETGTQIGTPAFFDVEDYEVLFFYYANSGEMKNAQNVLNQALAQHPENTELQFLETEYYLRKNNFSHALRCINEITEKEPYNTDALISKSNVLVHCNRVDEAMELLFETLRDLPEKEESGHIIMDFAYRIIDSEHIARAPEILLKAIKYPENEDEVICELVYVYEILETPEKAVAFLEDFLDDHPYSYTAWNNLGIIYLGKHEYKKALRAYDLCSVIHSDDPMAYFNKAMCLKALHEYEEAIELLKESLKYERNVKSLYLKNIADLYVETENYYEAEKYYLKACRTEEKLFGNEITTGCYISLAKVTAIQDRFKEAQAYAQKAVNESPERYDTHLALANILDQTNNPEAENHYQTALKKSPENELVYIDFSDHLYRSGKEEKAFELLHKAALQLEDPTMVNYQSVILNFKSGYYDDAYDLLFLVLENDEELADKLIEDLPEILNHPEFINLMSDYR